MRNEIEPVFLIDQIIMETDFASGGLMALSILAGSTSVDLLMKGTYMWGVIFLVVAGVFVFAREYFKVA